MKTLHLTLNKKWFDMISSGEKKEEYREIKPYWAKRLAHLSDDSDENDLESYEPRKIDIVSANNGYQKNCPNIKWKHEGVTIGEGKPEWGAEPGKKYFILKIGRLL